MNYAKIIIKTILAVGISIPAGNLICMDHVIRIHAAGDASASRAASANAPVTHASSHSSSSGLPPRALIYIQAATGTQSPNRPCICISPTSSEYRASASAAGIPPISALSVPGSAPIDTHRESPNSSAGNSTQNSGRDANIGSSPSRGEVDLDDIAPTGVGVMDFVTAGSPPRSTGPTAHVHTSTLAVPGLSLPPANGVNDSPRGWTASSARDSGSATPHSHSAAAVPTPRPTTAPTSTVGQQPVRPGTPRPAGQTTRITRFRGPFHHPGESVYDLVLSPPQQHNRLSSTGAPSNALRIAVLHDFLLSLNDDNNDPTSTTSTRTTGRVSMSMLPPPTPILTRDIVLIVMAYAAEPPAAASSTTTGVRVPASSPTAAASPATATSSAGTPVAPGPRIIIASASHPAHRMIARSSLSQLAREQTRRTACALITTLLGAGGIVGMVYALTH